MIEVTIAHIPDQATWDAAMRLFPHKPTKPCPIPWPGHPGTRWVRCYNGGQWKWMPIDIGIADLVEALQGPGAQAWRVYEDDAMSRDGRRREIKRLEAIKPLVETVGSCQGHGADYPPHVLLADGQVLVVQDGL